MKKICFASFVLLYAALVLKSPGNAQIVANASNLLPEAVYHVQPLAKAEDLMPATSTWAGYTLLKHIASCESWGDPNKEPREFLSDGQVLRGYPNPQDIGLAQINLPTWGATAAKLGFNIFTYQGNLAMAKWIFDNYGSKPWNWSKGCWGSFQ